MLLLRTPDVVTVYPAQDVLDPDTGIVERLPGNPLATGVTLRCWVQQPSSTSSAVDGYSTTEEYSLLARDFPGAARSVVLWQGRLFDVPAEPHRRRATPAMQHTTTRIVARTPGGAT